MRLKERDRYGVIGHRLAVVLLYLLYITEKKMRKPQYQFLQLPESKRIKLFGLQNADHFYIAFRSDAYVELANGVLRLSPIHGKIFT